MEGCGNWVFAEEKYYTFRARYRGQNLASFDFYFDNTTVLVLSFSIKIDPTILGTMKIKFSDGLHEIIAVYDGAFSLESGEDVVNLKGTFTPVGSLLQAAFEIYFTNKILDALDVSIYMSYEILNYTTGWELVADSYFNIYNLGGQATLETTGYGGRTTGGDAYELWAGKSGYTDLLYEDFESGTLDGWSLYQPNATAKENYIEIADEMAHEEMYAGYHSMVLNDDSDHMVGAWHTFLSQDSGMLYFQTWLYPQMETEALSIIVTNISTGGIGPWVYFDDNGKYYYKTSAGSYEIGSYTFNWKNLTLYINITAQTYDIYLNDVLRVSDVAFYETKTTLDVIIYSTYVGNIPAVETTKVFLDEIRVWRDPSAGSSGGSAVTTVIYRKLQHITVQFGIGFPNAFEALRHTGEGYIEWGIDYCINDIWIENAWKCRIEIIGSNVKGTTWGTAGNNWIKLSVKWYKQDVLITTGYFYSFWEGSPSGLSDLDTKADRIRVHLDLWFNKINASSTIGGRLNSYYYGMTDVEDPWFKQPIFGSDWDVVGSEMAQSTFFDDLEDNTGVVTSVKEITLMRIRTKVWRSADYSYMWRLQDLVITHEFAAGEMRGIDTPTFTPPEVPAMPSGGILANFINNINRVFSQLAEVLGSSAILGLWTIFVDFLDTIAATAGAPNFFSNLFDWIAEMLGFLTVSFEYLITITTAFFILIGALLASFLTIMGDLITSIVNTLTIFTDMMGGAYGVGVNIWETFGISTWIMVAMIFYPLYLIILWDQEGLDAVLKQLTLIFGILFWLFGFFVTVIQFTIGLITAVIESIPIAE